MQMRNADLNIDFSDRWPYNDSYFVQMEYEISELPDHQKVPILRLLVCLLPVANSDTLLFLLKFLKEVARHAYDTIGDQGVVLRGNRMTTLNLATIFGPTILRPGAAKGPTLVESDLAISCVQQLIENADDIVKVWIFPLPKEFPSS